MFFYVHMSPNGGGKGSKIFTTIDFVPIEYITYSPVTNELVSLGNIETSFENSLMSSRKMHQSTVTDLFSVGDIDVSSENTLLKSRMLYQEEINGLRTLGDVGVSSENTLMGSRVAYQSTGDLKTLGDIVVNFG